MSRNSIFAAFLLLTLSACGAQTQAKPKDPKAFRPAGEEFKPDPNAVLHMDCPGYMDVAQKNQWVGVDMKVDKALNIVISQRSHVIAHGRYSEDESNDAVTLTFTFDKSQATYTSGSASDSTDARGLYEDVSFTTTKGRAVGLFRCYFQNIEE